MGEWPSGKSFLTMARLRPCSKSRAITSWCTICVPVDRKEWLIAKRTFRVSDPRSNRANTSGGCRRLFKGMLAQDGSQRQLTPEDSDLPTCPSFVRYMLCPDDDMPSIGTNASHRSSE